MKPPSSDCVAHGLLMLDTRAGITRPGSSYSRNAIADSRERGELSDAHLIHLRLLREIAACRISLGLPPTARASRHIEETWIYTPQDVAARMAIMHTRLADEGVVVDPDVERWLADPV